MKIIFKEKRGELTTQQIVGLIILITSFVVILFFFFRLNLGEETQKEICHNSVVLKGKGTLAKLAAGGGSLDCRTNYVCISGGGECEGINPTETIEIDLSKDTAKNEIMKVVANEMADCWWMFGEGKINYVGNDLIDYHYAICSIVKFDKNINVDISYENLFEFLEKNKKDNTQTYLEYIFGVSKDEDFLVKSKYLQGQTNPFSFDEKYSIITGRNVEGFGCGTLGKEKCPDKVVPVYFIKTSDLNKNDNFVGKYDITKA
tara:strand:+ start:578 stop:1357 length:780 start_codon:yes stop_codon:yes gene_type:complete